MEHVGTVKNRSHSGTFIVLCDSKARFGGWDEHGDELADEGSLAMDLEGKRAFVEEGHGGKWEVCRLDTGEVWLTNPGDDGGLTIDQLNEPRIRSVVMGHVDAPSGTLAIALAYPPLNMTTTGDHEGVTHADGERVDIEGAAKSFEVSREFTEQGSFVRLKPV